MCDCLIQPYGCQIPISDWLTDWSIECQNFGPNTSANFQLCLNRKKQQPSSYSLINHLITFSTVKCNYRKMDSQHYRLHWSRAGTCPLANGTGAIFIRWLTTASGVIRDFGLTTNKNSLGLGRDFVLMHTLVTYDDDDDFPLVFLMWIHIITMGDQLDKLYIQLFW